MRAAPARIRLRNGHRVMRPLGGQVSLSAGTACEEHIALLITDVIMQGMQGREVAQRVSQIQPGIPVLYMSGYTEGLLSAQGVLDPGINLIAKPFNEASLLTKVRQV